MTCPHCGRPMLLENGNQWKCWNCGRSMAAENAPAEEKEESADDQR